MDEQIVPLCVRCGKEERHAVHMIKDGHDFVTEKIGTLF